MTYTYTAAFSTLALNIFSHSFIDLLDTDNMFFAMYEKAAFISHTTMDTFIHII